MDRKWQQTTGTPNVYNFVDNWKVVYGFMSENAC